jgi:tetratricopeptide (TPR) repeat protein
MPRLMTTLAAALAAALLLALGLAAPSLAQGEDDQRLCERAGNPRADRIEACARVIAAGGLGAGDLADIHETRGTLLIEAGDYETALGDFDAVLVLDPASRNANRLRGEALLYLGHPEEAIAELDIAIGINARFAPSFYLRGLAHAALGDVDAALADYDEAVNIDRQFVLAQVQRGRLLADAGRSAEAREAFDAVIAREIFEPRAYAGLGLVAEAEGDTEAAIRNYRFAQLLDPNLAAPNDRLPALVSAMTSDRTGPLGFEPPAEGLAVSYLTIVHDSDAAPAETTFEIGDKINWLDGPPAEALPTSLDLYRWDIGATDGTQTELTMTRIVNNTPTQYRARYETGMLALLSPLEEGEGVRLRYRQFDAVPALAPGDSAAGDGIVYALCGDQPGPVAQGLGCMPNVPDIRAGTFDWTATFAGWEYVLVPAGYRLAARYEFDAVFEVGFGEMTTFSRHTTVWVDPEIHWWIKREKRQGSTVETVEAVTIQQP